MFSVATLAVASPVYLRLFENPGATRLARLVVAVQLAPALALWLVDLGLARRAGPSWHRAWRGALFLAALLSVCRQAQVSLRLEALGVALAVVAAVILAVAASRTLGTFLGAFAPALLGWTIFVVAALGWPSPPGAAATGAARGPVFVLLFDGLDPAAFMRGGRVAADWPALHRLAARARTFTDATTNYGSTCPSVTVLLTGRLPAVPPPLTADCLETVPGLRASNVLSDLARERKVIVYGQPLRYCFDAAFDCRGTADLQARRPWLPLVQHWVPNGLRAAPGAAGMLGYSEHTYTRPLFEGFLADITAASARGAVFYLHLLLPHHPYVFGPDGGVHPPVYPGGSGERAHAEALRAYVDQARFADRLLGRFLDRLDAEGLADGAVIVVTSDHGLPPFEAFATPRAVDGIEVNSSRPRVVLMLQAPGLAPGATAAPYQHLEFRRLLSAAIHGDGASPPEGAGGRERWFCDDGRWHVRGEDGRWVPREARGCEAPAS